MGSQIAFQHMLTILRPASTFSVGPLLQSAQCSPRRTRYSSAAQSLALALADSRLSKALESP